MSWGYFYLFTALASFTVIGICHKVADHKKCRPSAVNALLFVWAFALLSAYMIASKGLSSDVPRIVVGWGISSGIFAAIAILAFQVGIRYGKISTSWLVINLSGGIPTLASLILYDEKITPKRAMGLLLAGLSLWLLWKDKKEESLASSPRS